jgi:hypothetical protein
MAAPADEPYETPKLIGRSAGHGLHPLLVDDVTALRGVALQAGGSSVFAPDKTEWGTERARVLDPEGYEWSFGTYEPGGSLVSAGRFARSGRVVACWRRGAPTNQHCADRDRADPPPRPGRLRPRMGHDQGRLGRAATAITSSRRSRRRATGETAPDGGPYSRAASRAGAA